jgi:D-proline reductase (dithiol) PrdB
LVARHLEEAGIPTVIIGSARDIVEECGVPRFVFADFPLGNPIGKPDDVDMQSATVELALATLETAIAARTTVQTPFVWSPGDDGWRERYMTIADAEALATEGARRRARQAEQKVSGPARSD